MDLGSDRYQRLRADLAALKRVREASLYSTMVPPALIRISASDEHRCGNQAAVTLRKFWSLPDIAEQDLIRERYQPRCKVANQLLCRGLPLRFRHFLSSHY